MAGLGNKLRCTLCLEEIDYLENPKQLPCTHVYCLLCLERKVQSVETGGLQVVCSICSKKHALKDLQDLPTPTQEDQSNQDNSLDAVSDASTPVVSSQYPDSESATTQCDKCKTKGVEKEAVCYCADCDRKLCNHHNQLHDDFHEDDGHKLVDIKKYLARPGVYFKPKCELHGYDIGVCCEKCLSLKCSRCKADDKCQDKAAHAYHTLEDIEPKLNSEFSNLLKECATMLTAICKVEKETWFELDGYEEKCQKLIDQVEAKEKELVSTIRRESSKYKEYIKLCKLGKKNEVEEYLQKLRTKSDEIEESRLKCEQLLRNQHVTEIVKQKKQRISELEEAKRPTYSGCEFNIKNITGTLKKFLDTEFLLTPDTLYPVSTHSTPSTCYSVTYTAEGDILASCNSGLYLYDKTTNFADSICLIEDTVYSASMIASTVWYVTTAGDWEIVKSIVLDDHRRVGAAAEEVFKFAGNSKVPYLTASDIWIVARQPVRKGLVIYDRRNKAMCEKTFAFNPLTVLFSIDGSLLMSDGDRLRQYRIHSNGDMIMEWKSVCLNAPQFICNNEKGQIIVTAESSLSILSKEGKVLTSITHSAMNMEGFGSSNIYGYSLVLADKEGQFKVLELI